MERIKAFLRQFRKGYKLSTRVVSLLLVAMLIIGSSSSVFAENEISTESTEVVTESEESVEETVSDEATPEAEVAEDATEATAEETAEVAAEDAEPATQDAVVEETEEAASEDAEEAEEDEEEEDELDAAALIQKELDASTKTTYTYSDGSVVITATLSNPKSVPDSARLVATPVTASTAGYNYDAYMNALNNSDAGETTYSAENTLLYDIRFLYNAPQEDGTKKEVEFEPVSGLVQVSMQFAQSQLTDGIGAENASDVNVKHLELSDAVVENTDTTKDATSISASDISVSDMSGSVQASGDNSIAFTTSSFSVYAFTAGGNPTNPSEPAEDSSKVLTAEGIKGKITVGGITYDVSSNPKLKVDNGETFNLNLSWEFASDANLEVGDKVVYNIGGNVEDFVFDSSYVGKNIPVYKTGSDEVIGNMTINGGTITVEYTNEKFCKESNRTTKLNLWGTFNKNGNNEDNEDHAQIIFPGLGTIDGDVYKDVSKTSLKVEKGNPTRNPDGTFTYILKVTATGENNNVLLTDKIQNSLMTLHPDSVAFFIDSACSNAYSNSNVTKLSSDKTGFEYQIDKLKDETIYVKYLVDIDSTVFTEGKETSNKAVIKSDETEHRGDNNEATNTVKKSMISKYGSVNNGEITWTIEVNPGVGSNLKDYVLKDVLGKDQTFINGSLHVYESENGSAYIDSSIPITWESISGDGYTFGDTYKSYKVVYKTQYSTTESNAQITNKATLEGDRKTFPADGTVTVNPSEGFSIKKYILKEDGETWSKDVTGTSKNVTWKVEVNIPDNYTAHKGGDNDAYWEFEDILPLGMVANSAKVIREDGIEDTNWDINIAHNSKDGRDFVSAKLGSDNFYVGKFYLLIESTILNPVNESYVSDGESKSQNYNDAYFNNQYAQACYSYIRKSTITKFGDGVSADKKSIKWKVTIKDINSTTNKITIVDTLPEGTTLDRDSFYLQWNNNGKWGEAKSSTINQYLDINSVEDGKFTIIPTSDFMDLARQGTVFYLKYETKIDREVQEDQTQKYYNSISLQQDDDLTPDVSTGSQEVTRESVVKKSMKDYVKADGNMITYYVEVNKDAKDLNPNGNTVTLTDTMGPVLAYVTGTMSIKDSEGNELLDNGASFTSNPISREMTLVIPDNTAVKISYKARLTLAKDEWFYDTDAYNKCQFTANSGVTDSSEVKFSGQVFGAAAEASSDSVALSIYKYRTGSPTTSVSGASFSVQKLSVDVDGTSAKVKGTVGNALTGESNQYGFASFNLEHNEVYCITETSAPAGYIKSNKKIYVVEYGKNSTTDWKNITSWKDESDKDIEVVVRNYGQEIQTSMGNDEDITPTGDFTISKSVVSDIAADKAETKTFNFTVTLGDTSINGIYNGVTFTNGVATFTLSNGKTKTISGLPQGTTYTVTETADDLFTTTVNGTAGTSIEGTIGATTQTAAFVNTRKTGELEIAKTVSSDVTSDQEPTKKFTFKIELTDKTIEGTYSGVAFTNGEATVELSHGGKKTISGLPQGVGYTVTETADTLFTTKVNGETGSAASGTIGATKQTVAFENTRKTGSLSVSKTVESTIASDKTKTYNFTVTLTGVALNGTYGNMEFSNGVATVALTDGQTKTATGLPAGITYTVAETAESSNGFTVTKTGETGTITADATKAANFSNVKAKGGLVVSKSVVSDIAADKAETKTFNFTVTLGDTSINGTYNGVTFTNGVATFTLYDGQTKTITGLPQGTTYTVTETADDLFTTTSTGATGTIGATAQTAAFTNTRKTGDLEVKKTVSSDLSADLATKFTFTVRLGESITGTYSDVSFTDGVATVQLANGDTKKISGLPQGITYSVAETENSNFTTTATGATGSIGATKQIADFTNTRKTGSLSVTKSVTSSTASDLKKDYNFTVTLSDTTINKTYGDMAFTNGVANVAVKNGETKTATGLPVGITYTVAETAESSNGFTVTKTGETGTITADATQAASISNVKAEGALVITKEVKSDVSDDLDTKFSFTVELSDTSVDGTYGDLTFKNGVANVTLKNGETVTATGLPQKTTYIVTEEANDLFATTSTGETGTIGEAAQSVKFINTRKTGELKLSKTVESDNDSDKSVNKKFEFTIELSDKTITGIYSGVSFTNGVATVELSHNETKTISGLPAGLKYSVEESKDSSKGFKVTKSGESGKIVADETQEASFTNTLNKGDDEITPVSITLKKVDASDTSKTLAFAFFTVTDPDGKTHTEFTGLSGTTTIKFTKEGTYTITENRAPSGYVKTEQVYTVVVTKEGPTRNFDEKKNSYYDSYELKVTSGASNGVLTITNSKKPEAPTTPPTTPPETPPTTPPTTPPVNPPTTPPTTPETPTTPPSTSRYTVIRLRTPLSVRPGTRIRIKTPLTGDNSLGYVLAAIGALVVGAGAVILGKKKNSK